MPRPKSKSELLDLSQSNFEKLNDFVNSFSENEKQKEFPPGTLNRNIRDVFAHLHQWHLMLLEWYKIGMTGVKPDMPAKGYTWKMNSELNRKIWEDYQSIDLRTITQLLADSHSKVCDIINQHSNEELFEKKKYKWTGSTSMGAYLISATSSHYDWAIKLIKKSTKDFKN